MILPQYPYLPIGLLAACFNRTTATYKFYWLLAILQGLEDVRDVSGSGIENGPDLGSDSGIAGVVLEKRELFARMIANAWYTVNYFHISFGRQDLIQEAIREVNRVEAITIDEKREVVVQKLLTSEDSRTRKLLWHFNRNVPHWFLSPWFPRQGNETEVQRGKRIYATSQRFESSCLYALYPDFIRINPTWQPYLMAHARILKDFCYWNLTLFLQGKNPNVPDIANKLIKPAGRNALTRQRRQFWDVVLEELGSVRCIYTGGKLIKGNYAVEHFIPYSFVSHDLIWNLIPADKTFNSIKSNKLPRLEKYFEPFFDLQKNAYDILRRKAPRNKLLEDYLTILPGLGQEQELNENRFREAIQPLVSIASNNGFEFMT